MLCDELLFCTGGPRGGRQCHKKTSPLVDHSFLGKIASKPAVESVSRDAGSKKYCGAGSSSSTGWDLDKHLRPRAPEGLERHLVLETMGRDITRGFDKHLLALANGRATEFPIHDTRMQQRQQIHAGLSCRREARLDSPPAFNLPGGLAEPWAGVEMAHSDSNCSCNKDDMVPMTNDQGRMMGDEKGQAT